MPNPFQTIDELFLEVLEGQLPAALISKLLTNQATILGNQADIRAAILADFEALLANQENAIGGSLDAIRGALSMIIDTQKSVNAELLAIKTYIGMGAPPVATQKQLDQLGQQLTQETAAVEQFDGSMKVPVTEAPPTPITKE